MWNFRILGDEREFFEENLTVWNEEGFYLGLHIERFQII